MDYFPLFARLDGRRCLVVGGGRVAERKVRRLLDAGADVTVNAPALNEALESLARDGGIRWAAGAFDPAGVDRHLFVIAATSDRRVNEQVAQACRNARRLCNVVDDNGLSSAIVPAIIDRSPLIVAIGTGGAAPALARIVRQRIEAWLPDGLERLASAAGQWRQQVGARLENHAQRLRFWQQVFDGPIGRQLSAGRTAEAERSLEAALAAAAREAKSGEVWIVGAGPGDPGLITQRGLQFLQRADVVFHDRLVSPGLLDFARRDAEIIPVGKAPGGPSVSQARINALLVERARRGQRVCRLKGGDPLIFGRGAEEAAALARAGLAWQLVPGITAAAGCAAAAGIPLTHRDFAAGITLVTASRAEGAEDKTDWPALARLHHTLVVYMGVRRLADVSRALIAGGRKAGEAAAIVERGTTPAQRVIGGTLATIGERAEQSGVRAPAVLIVGRVTDPSVRFTWTGLPGDGPGAARDTAATAGHH